MMSFSMYSLKVKENKVKNVVLFYVFDYLLYTFN